MSTTADKPEHWEEVVPKEPGGGRLGLVVGLLAVAAVLIWWSNRPGEMGPGGLPVPVIAQGGHSLERGVPLRLEVPPEGREWVARFTAEAGPLEDREGLSGRVVFQRGIRADVADPTGEGEVGLALTSSNTSLAVEMWDEKDPEPQDALVLLRIMGGVDPEAALQATDGLPLTYSLSPSGGVRDIQGVEPLLAALVSALDLGEIVGDSLDESPLLSGEGEVRGALEEARGALEEEGILDEFPFLDGPLPREPVTTTTRIGFSTEDLLALFGGGPADGIQEELGEEVPDISWELIPKGLRAGAVVFEIAMSTDWEGQGGEGRVHAEGSGEAEIEISTGLPRRVDWEIRLDLAADLGFGMDFSTPLVITYRLTPS